MRPYTNAGGALHPAAPVRRRYAPPDPNKRGPRVGGGEAGTTPPETKTPPGRGGRACVFYRTMARTFTNP